MAHHLRTNGVYRRLTDRLNKHPQGAPPSELLYKILAMLFSEREAELVSVLPVKQFRVAKAAKLWKMGEAEARGVLEELAGRALLVDFTGEDGDTSYALPPPMAGFFEFSMMRIRGDIDQKLLAELFFEYMNVEEDFIRELFTQGETQLGRAFVQEPMLTPANSLHVLDYERATEVIKTATTIGVSTCYCRHKMMHMDRACSAPLNICMTFNSAGSSMTRHGFARPVEAAECLELLDQAYEANLVQFGENNRQGVNFICNCCGCCCEAMIAAQRFGHLHPVHTTNFLPEVNRDVCKGCLKCVTACPVEAMGAVSANAGAEPKRKATKVDENLCLGCGVCARVCPEHGISLKPRAARVVTPLDSFHRTVLMAVERGKLQDLVFDNQVAKSHRALAAVLGVVLRLPPVKRTLASKQLASRYVEALCARLGG